MPLGPIAHVTVGIRSITEQRIAARIYIFHSNLRVYHRCERLLPVQARHWESPLLRTHRGQMDRREKRGFQSRQILRILQLYLRLEPASEELRRRLANRLIPLMHLAFGSARDRARHDYSRGTVLAHAKREGWTREIAGGSGVAPVPPPRAEDRYSNARRLRSRIAAKGANIFNCAEIASCCAMS
jgi:hypothetical protein